MIVSHGPSGASAITHILILGGTTEGSGLAAALAENGAHATLSYAGRTERPRAQPVPVRIGGFGGAVGLTDFLRSKGITHLVDATHPFAATISANAVAAACTAGVRLIRLTRPAWMPGTGDRWISFPDIPAAVEALAGSPRRVMLAIGRMHVEAFAAQAHHHYLLRFVDVPDRPLALPDHSLVVDRGPFTVEGDSRLMRDHAIDLVLCKNAGGEGAAAKLAAARILGLPVFMIERPALPEARVTHSVAEVLNWLDHPADLGV